MCGIFGVSMKPSGSKRVVLQKFKILGLYNIKRGRDASGVFVNGEIIKGIGRISEFDDFIEDTVIPLPKDNSVMLGHTRQGSVGYKKTIDEAHPFLINDDLVFTHNGTIKNIKFLCDKYRKIESEFSVDSQALGTILMEDGTDVLEDYTGAAALAYTFKSDPGTLYIYHGQSKEYKNGILIEERPLYFMDTKDGIFYSSLEESLEAIRDEGKEEVHNLKYNHIYKIRDGKFIIEDTVEIFRDEANVSVYVAPVHVGKQNKIFTTNTIGTGTVNSPNSRGISIKDEQLIKRETLPCKLLELKEKKDHIYFHLGRYWEAPRKVLEGPKYIKKGGAVGTFDDKVSELYFFWAGAMLHSKAAYMELLALSQEKIERNWVRFPNESNFALCLSKYSIWPVTNIGSEGFTLSSFYKNQWYFAGGSAKSSSYTPKFSCGRCYKIEGGFLVNIAASQREKTLYETAEMATTEVEALKRGYLLAGTPGGSSQDTPFLLGQSNETTANHSTESPKKVDELIWYFDIPLTSLAQGMENIGVEEMDSLRDFVKIMFKRDFNLTMLEKEVDIEVGNMIQEAVNKKCTIMETVTDEMDKYVLLNSYEEAIDKSNRQKSLQSTLDFDKRSLVETFSLDGTGEDEEEAERMLEEEQIDDLVEGSIVDLENLQIGSMELMDAQNSDYAQECAGIIITGVNGMLSNMESALYRHGKADFVARVKKIRDTKSMADGVL